MRLAKSMKLSCVLSIIFLCPFVFASYLVKYKINEQGNITQLISAKKTQPQTERLIKKIPSVIGEKTKTPFESEYYIERVVNNLNEFKDLKSDFKLKLQGLSEVEILNSEVRTLVDQGPTANRIDLTILGDGYTLAEKEKFFLDAERITHDLFTGNTFASYLPLFNVHAVFVASKESGLSDVKKVNTVFGLYRYPHGSKRAIMPGKTSAIENALSLAPDTDYPIIMANDDFYGGLGGQYAITTRSVTSGSMVLRHELGHNFGDVGEEYDGGEVYSGANFSSTSNVNWKHWVQGNLEVFESVHFQSSYAWKNMTNNPINMSFNFPNNDSLFDIIISSVGWSKPDEVSVKLNGVEQELNGNWTADRSFFTLKNLPTINKGQNSIDVSERISDGDNVFAFAHIYAHPKNIVTTEGFVGAYSNFDSRNQMRGYRPTFNTCLMKSMESQKFCVVDQENMWIKFFGRVGLIDQVQTASQAGVFSATVVTPQLNGLIIKWYQKINGSFQLIARDQTNLNQLKSGTYKVEVEFKTAEVTKPNTQFKSQREFSL